MVAELARRLAGGEEVALVTAVGTKGTPPCASGDKLLVGTAGPIEGTLGCSELDTAAVALARSAMAAGEATLGVLDQSHGQVDVYVEPYGARANLVLASPTPIARWLARWALDLGYAVVVIDDKALETAPYGTTPYSGAATPKIVASVDTLHLQPSDAVVATDHDAPCLVPTLSAALAAGCGYVAAVGSRRHIGAHIARLAQDGVSPEAIARIQTPAGLDIGGRSAQEIALSILAAVVAARNGRPGGPMATAPI